MSQKSTTPMAYSLAQMMVAFAVGLMISAVCNLFVAGPHLLYAAILPMIALSLMLTASYGINRGTPHASPLRAYVLVNIYAMVAIGAFCLLCYGVSVSSNSIAPLGLVIYYVTMIALVITYRRFNLRVVSECWSLFTS